jgi:pyruvate dehydrogenase (quinone)
VDRAEDIGAAWDRALSAGRPFVFEAITDPDVPPMPPHITIEQAKDFASSVLKRDVDALGYLKQTAKQVMADYMPKKK